MTFLLTNFGKAVLEAPVSASDTTFLIDEEASQLLPNPTGDEEFALTLWDGYDFEIVYVQDNPGTGVLEVIRNREGTTPRGWLTGTQVRHSLTAGTITNLLQTGFISGNMASEAEAIAGVANDRLMSPLRTQDHFEARTTEFSRDFLLSEDAVAGRRVLGWATAIFSGTGLETTFQLPDESYDTAYTRVYVDEALVDASEYDIMGDTLIFDSPPNAGVDNIVVILGENFAFSVSTPGNNSVTTPTIVDLAVTTAKIANLAVTTGKIADKAVTYAKIQDVSATDKVIGRSTAGSGPVEEIPFTSVARGFTALSTIALQQAYLTTTGWPVPTGMVAAFLTSTLPSGWAKANGQTIGSASSGATGRANADTAALFEVIWNSTSNTTSVIQTSAGAPTTRGASAAADFAANKRLPLPDLRGEWIRGWDDGRSVDTGRAFGSTQADLVKAHTHTLTMDAVGAHGHPARLSARNDSGPVQTTYGGMGLIGLGSSDYAAYTGTISDTAGQQIGGGGAHTPTGVANANTGTENRPRNVALAYYIKL